MDSEARRSLNNLDYYARRAIVFGATVNDITSVVSAGISAGFDQLTADGEGDLDKWLRSIDDC